jgi:hypothetical protein
MTSTSLSKTIARYLNGQQIMIDLETLGTDIHAPIIAIGATVFTFQDGPIGTPFYVPIKMDSAIDSGAVPSGDTISWWMSQSEAARKHFFPAAQKAAYTHLNGLEEFIAWYNAQGGRNKLKVWGNGPTFDLGKLAESMRREGLAEPWSYNGEQCMRTIVSMGTALGLDIKKHPREGTHHQAVDDAIFQASFVSKVVRTVMGAES